MTPLDGRTARIGVRLFKDRSRTSDGDLLFEFVGERHEIVLAFWRAPFPKLEMASLTECLNERGLLDDKARRS